MVSVMLVSCGDDDNTIPELETDKTQQEDPKLNTGSNGEKITNIPLLVALKRAGLTFEDDRLIIDDKVKNLTSLDLSDESIRELKGLELFPKLEDLNLSNNEIQKFDFSKLSQNVKSIQLQGNPINEYLNLDVNRKFIKLYLSELAVFDMDEILNYYKVNKDDVSLDMQYEKDGKLVKYDFLREVANAEVFSILKETFPSVFVNDKIDLSKPLSQIERNTDFKIGTRTDEFRFSDSKNNNLDGIQFIICRDEYRGNVLINVSFRTPISYFKAPKNVPSICIKDIRLVDGGLFDMSTAINAHSILLSAVSGDIKKLDFSKNVKIGDPVANNGKGGKLLLFNLDITNILMPQKWQEMTKVKVCFRIVGLSKLKELDLSKVTDGTTKPNILARLTVRNDINIKYPEKYNKLADQVGEDKEKVLFVTDKSLRATDDWKAFSEKYKDTIRYGDEGIADYVSHWVYLYGSAWE